MKEDLITTYKQFQVAIKNKKENPVAVKGLGRLYAYYGLEFLKKQLEKDYSEEFEDSLVAVIGYIDDLENIYNLERSDK